MGQMMFQRTFFNKLTDDICGKLIEKGFVIHRYDAYSTDSIYLKLDYGVCNSIRISDHKGKGYLKYRYNIGANIEDMFVEHDKYDRYYYSLEHLDEMIEQIVSDRDAKVKKYGRKNYEKYMDQNKETHAKDAGFWSKSRRVLC